MNELSTDHELLVVGVHRGGKGGMSECRRRYRRYAMRVTSVALDLAMVLAILLTTFGVVLRNLAMRALESIFIVTRTILMDKHICCLAEIVDYIRGYAPQPTQVQVGIIQVRGVTYVYIVYCFRWMI